MWPKMCIKVKANCTLVQALRLCTGRTAHRGSGGIALLFLDHGTRRRWKFSATPRPLFTTGKDPVLIGEESGWAPGPVWTDAENLAPPPTGFDPRTAQPVARCYTDWAIPAHKKCIGVPIKYPFYSCRILMRLDRFSKIPDISNFMKIRQVGAELFHADGRADNSRLPQLSERAYKRFYQYWGLPSLLVFLGDFSLIFQLRSVIHQSYPMLTTPHNAASQAWSGPEGSRELRLPDFMATAQDDGKVVSLPHQLPLPPGNTPGTHFCQRLSRPQGHSAIGRILCQ